MPRFRGEDLYQIENEMGKYVYLKDDGHHVMRISPSTN